ncbi:MAG: hypothetical protein EXS12_00020 [Phycisphaerales bacterium]|nr:hypothetical protein [Phycisphaerales bacterium]
MHGVSPIDVLWMEVSNEGITLLTKTTPLRNPPVFPMQPAQFHPRTNPIAAQQICLKQNFRNNLQSLLYCVTETTIDLEVNGNFFQTTDVAIAMAGGMASSNGTSLTLSPFTSAGFTLTAMLFLRGEGGSGVAWTSGDIVLAAVDATNFQSPSAFAA